MSRDLSPDGPEARWIAEVTLSPFRRAVLAYLATLRDTPRGLLRRLEGQGWWFLGWGRLPLALRALERNSLIRAELGDFSGEATGEYSATRLGILWLNAHAAGGRPPNRDEWKILGVLADAGGSATGLGIDDILEDVSAGRIVKGLRALEAAGHLTVDDRDIANFRRARYALTTSGRQLLELRRANHGG